MPFANEHACRIRNPADFQDDSFRRIRQNADGKPIDLIVARLKGESSTTLQAFRYPKKNWTADQARSHCSSHNGNFEAASDEDEQNSLDTRFCDDLEYRQSAGGEPHLVGHAARFNSLSDDLGGFRELVLPGAFKRSLRENSDIRALVDHDPSKILGRTNAGTLKVFEDKMGLAVDIQPPDTQAGRDVATSIRRGDVDQMSFAFSVVSEDWETKDSLDIRTLEEVRLHEVSIVTFPAYPQTHIALRSLKRWKNSQKTREIYQRLARLDSRIERG